MAALSLRDEDPPLPGVDVAERQSQHLAAAQATEHHRLDHSSVPAGAQGGEEGIDLAGREHPGQGTGSANEYHPSLALGGTWTAGRQPPGNRVCGDAGVTPDQEVRVQAREAGQASGDGAGCQPCFTVLETHDLGPAPGRALLLQEREHIRRGDRRRLLGDHREEDLEVVGNGEPGVGPGTCADKGEVVVEQRVAELDRGTASSVSGADETGRPGHGLSFRRVGKGSWIPAPRGSRIHPHIKHSYASTTAVYTTVGSDYKNRMLRAALSRAFDPHLGESGP